MVQMWSTTYFTFSFICIGNQRALFSVFMFSVMVVLWTERFDLFKKSHVMIKKCYNYKLTISYFRVKKNVMSQYFKHEKDMEYVSDKIFVK